ncbi:MAG: HAD family hydrolase [Ktedonobacteraceae bacterium]
MLRLDIPQRGIIELHHAVFDINGTLAVDGIAMPQVIDALKVLSAHLSIHLLSAGTHGNITYLEADLGFPLHLISKGEEKTRYVQELGSEHVVASGNGINDVGMLRLATIGIAVMTSEGIATRVLQAADILVSSPLDALNLLLKPKRLIATLRG